MIDSSGFLLLVIVDYCVCDDLGAENPANVVVSPALPGTQIVLGT